MIDGDAYLTDLLAEIQADRTQARRFRLLLSVRRVLAVVGGQDAKRRRLTLQLRIIADSMAHLRLGEAEVQEQLSLPNGSLSPSHR